MTTLRERAAIAAMREMVRKLGHGIYHPEDLAIDAVKCADALLAELERTKPKPKVDPASYHAGLEAAAKLTEGLDDGRMNPEMARLVAHVAAFIRALPTPSTLPEEGGNHGR